MPLVQVTSVTTSCFFFIFFFLISLGGEEEKEEESGGMELGKLCVSPQITSPGRVCCPNIAFNILFVAPSLGAGSKNRENLTEAAATSYRRQHCRATWHADVHPSGIESVSSWPRSDQSTPSDSQ